jgi:hypothetical protein
MSVAVVRTNHLCNTCLYIPAYDFSDRAERRCAIEVNDLCSECAANPQIYGYILDPREDINVIKQVRALSPWHLRQNAIHSP